jgi:hypothetical protein
MDKELMQRNRRRVEDTFRVIDIMEDIRDLWRQNAPLQQLDEPQKEQLVKKLEKVRKAVERIEASL